MFQGILLETTPAERRRRKLTLLASILSEGLVLAAVIAIPLLYLDAVPGLSVHAQSIETPVSDLRPVEIVGATHAGAGQRSVALAQPGQYVVQRTVQNAGLVTNLMRPESDEVTTNQLLVRSGSCCTSAIGDAIGSAPPRPAPPPRPAMLRMSQLDPGMIVRQVNPVYPALAKATRTQGEVVLRATIGSAGEIENLQVVSGHPLLAPAALDAVRQWRFRPYYLNGSAIEVQAQITVRFVLDGN